MTDVAPGADPAQSPPEPPQIRILAQFIRDLSFENPKAPDSLRVQGEPPSIEMGVEMNARGRADGLFEVDLKLTAQATREGNETAFQIELVYGGLFEIANTPPDQMEAVLLIECPRFLFPFARRIVADLSMEGGFPPFMLDPIDFAGVYLAQRAQRENAGLGAAGANGGGLPN